MSANPAKTMLSPDNHSLLMIDHQYLQMLTIRSHGASELINHAVALVEAAAIFKVPMLTTTAFKERQGLVAPLAEATKAVKPIDRTTLNSWEDPRIVDWVEKTGRKKIVIAGQWTEVCVAMPVLSALDAGYEVYVVTDACGGASIEAHDMAVERMVQAGARPITTLGLCVRTAARLGTRSNRWRRHQIVRTTRRRLWPGPVVGMGPVKP
jgi:nicotinamidase-related amidase